MTVLEIDAYQRGYLDAKAELRAKYKPQQAKPLTVAELQAENLRIKHAPKDWNTLSFKAQQYVLQKWKILYK